MTIRVEIFSSPGCPNAAAAKAAVTECLAALSIDVPIIERAGRYLSPTVLVDGVDVIRHDEGAQVGDACRLDLPTAQRILDALRKDLI
jgi:hypothetical protein